MFRTVIMVIAMIPRYIRFRFFTNPCWAKPKVHMVESSLLLQTKISSIYIVPIDYKHFVTILIHSITQLEKFLRHKHTKTTL